MDELRKINETNCPHCGRVIERKTESYKLPPEILAIIKQMGINIKDFKKY